MELNKICPHCMREVEEGAFCPHCGKNVAERQQLPPFTILNGKYLVGDVLGEGGFGITYIGLDLTLEIRVAIKEFFPAGHVARDSATTTQVTVFAGQDEENIARWQEEFLDEARCLVKCKELPGVVDVKGFFNENNTAYFVQEFLDGMTLKDYMASLGGKIPVDVLMPAMEPVVVALAQVHNHGLIHRDISPDNIMRLKDGTMKLFDFGAAKLLGDTSEKSMVLKPGYAPEEQYRKNGNQGPWSDVYALCATFYKCLTGETPVEANERMRQDILKAPSMYGVMIPPAIEATLLQGMAVYAENRIQNMNALHTALYSNYVPMGNIVRGQTVPVMGTMERTMPMVNQVSVDAYSDDDSVTMPLLNNGQTMQMPNNGQTMPLPNNGQTMPLPNNGQPAMMPGYGQQTPAKKSKAPLILGIIGGVAVFAIVIVVVLVLVLGGKDKDRTDGDEMKAQTETTTTETETKPETVVEEPAQENDADQALAEIADHFAAAEDWSAQAEVLPEYYALLEANGVQDGYSEQIAADYAAYCESLNAFLDNMNAVDPSPAIYGEMSNDMQVAVEIGQELDARGAFVDYAAMQARRDNLQAEYTTKLCEKYDGVADNAINTNGQISRSELWKIMEGADSCGIYDDGDACHPVRTRFASALAFHIDSEIGSMTADEAVKYIYENLEESQFSLLLLYYLAYAYADGNGTQMFEQASDIIRNYTGVDFYNLSDPDKKNFIYYFSHSEYDGARNEILNTIGASFYNPYE